MLNQITDKGVYYYLVNFFLNTTTGTGLFEYVEKAKELERTLKGRVKIYGYRTHK